MRDPSTWPTDTTPVWASSKQIIHGVSSPTELVNECLVGVPNPPALKDLESHYGPKGKHGGKSWRHGSKRAKAWCIRKKAHDVTDEQGREAALQCFHQVISEEFGDLLVGGLTVENPGPSVMKKLLEHLKKQKPGAAERSQKAFSRKRGEKEGSEVVPTVVTNAT